MHGCWTPGVWGWHFIMLKSLIGLLVIAGIVWLSVWLAGRSRLAAPAESALEVLKKRYAKGEISREDYERMKQDLS